MEATSVALQSWQNLFELTSARSCPSEDLAKLYRDHGALVYRRALRILRNSQDAQEATQEVFVRVLSTRCGYRGTGELLGWLYRITTHYCLNRLRDSRRRGELFAAHVLPMAESSTTAKAADQVMVRWLLANADEQQAQAATYIFFDGMSYEEAAEVMGVSRSTVSNLMRRFQTWAAQQECVA